MALAHNLLALARALARRELSAVEVTGDYLRRAESATDLNAFITLAPERALEQAAQADQSRSKGADGALLGVPMAHKDIFCTEGLLTTCGSKILGNVVAPYSATAVAQLDQAGCVTLGKTNLDEFAMGSSTENSAYGATRNPWDASRVPGGSSGGSAAAVAAGLCAFATGTDTGGSIRQPAAFCGISGIKPTYGRVSRYGMVAFASSLDQGGVLGHTAADLTCVLAAMQGPDERDGTSAPQRDPWLDTLAGASPDAIENALQGAARPLRIGLPAEYYADDIEGAEALAGLRRLAESLGHTCVDLSLPNTGSAIPAYYVIAGAEASTNLSRFDGVRYGHRSAASDDLASLYRRSRSEGFGDEVKRRILTGTYALSVGYYDAYYLKAQQLRRLIQQDFLTAFESVDVLLAPTTPTPAFGLNTVSDPVTMYQQDIYTVPVSLAGLPALSLPCGLTQGLPVGAQLIGPHFGERTLLALAHQLQQHSDWHEQRPPTQPVEDVA
ncbi:MAG: Asp-tRNA(Asn)/Glu-tRNA(Gln) amidotransferase subunit GatA [Pseudomonadota bacterium]